MRPVSVGPEAVSSHQPAQTAASHANGAAQGGVHSQLLPPLPRTLAPGPDTEMAGPPGS